MKGILFKPWKIRFIAKHPDMELQTRRVTNPQPERGLSIGCYLGEGYPTEFVLTDWYGDTIDAKCPQPRYRVGEIVYIKEAYWAVAGFIVDHKEFDDQVQVKYSPDGAITWVHKPRSKEMPAYGYHSPMMMPEWAARYYIEITGVNAERLRQITLPDCRAECFGDDFILAKLRFINTWDSINKGYPWGSDPWVYAYRFYLTKGVNSGTMPEMSQATN